MLRLLIPGSLQLNRKDRLLRALPILTGTNALSTYYQIDFRESNTSFTGCTVPSGTTIPEDMATRLIRTGQYLSIESKNVLPTAWTRHGVQYGNFMSAFRIAGMATDM